MRILILDDCPDFRQATCASLSQMGHRCLSEDVCSVALEKIAQREFDVLFFDIQLVDRRGEGLELIPHFLAADDNLKLVVTSALSSVAGAVESMQAGASNYLAKPLVPDNLKRCLNLLERKTFPISQKLTGQQPSGSNVIEANFATQVPCMRTAFDLAARAAPTSTTLLLLGESGTGKTTLARAIHSQSREKDGPFVTVNCPSLSKELFESDLFGHVRGAFTGAVRDKSGKVAHAKDGTLFLDEIGELPLEIQPKLLRLIQEREYERVGDPGTITAKVRVIAATNKDLGEEVRAGRFREDLFYRLNVVPIEVPALRDRIGDLPELAENKLKILADEMGKTNIDFSDEAMHAMCQYGWPGNLRELHNALEHALVMTSGDRIELAHFPAYLRSEECNNLNTCQVGSPVSLETLERAQIEHILQNTRSREEAAAVLGIDPTTLYRKRKRYAITPPKIAISA